jgi:hypothetical protein
VLTIEETEVINYRLKAYGADHTHAWLLGYASLFRRKGGSLETARAYINAARMIRLGKWNKATNPAQYVAATDHQPVTTNFPTTPEALRTLLDFAWPHIAKLRDSDSVEYAKLCDAWYTSEDHLASLVQK